MPCGAARSAGRPSSPGPRAAARAARACPRRSGAGSSRRLMGRASASRPAGDGRRPPVASGRGGTRSRRSAGRRPRRAPRPRRARGSRRCRSCCRGRAAAGREPRRRSPRAPSRRSPRGAPARARGGGRCGRAASGSGCGGAAALADGLQEPPRLADRRTVLAAPRLVAHARAPAMPHQYRPGRKASPSSRVRSMTRAFTSSRRGVSAPGRRSATRDAGAGGAPRSRRRWPGGRRGSPACARTASARAERAAPRSRRPRRPP